MYDQDTLTEYVEYGARYDDFDVVQDRYAELNEEAYEDRFARVEDLTEEDYEREASQAAEDAWLEAWQSDPERMNTP